MTSHTFDQDQQLTLYSSGFLSGAASVLAMIGVPDLHAQRYATTATKRMMDDPALRQEILDAISRAVTENAPTAMWLNSAGMP